MMALSRTAFEDEMTRKFALLRFEASLDLRFMLTEQPLAKASPGGRLVKIANRMENVSSFLGAKITRRGLMERKNQRPPR